MLPTLFPINTAQLWTWNLLITKLEITFEKELRSLTDILILTINCRKCQLWSPQPTFSWAGNSKVHLDSSPSALSRSELKRGQVELGTNGNYWNGRISLFWSNGQIGRIGSLVAVNSENGNKWGFSIANCPLPVFYHRSPLGIIQLLNNTNITVFTSSTAKWFWTKPPDISKPVTFHWRNVHDMKSVRMKTKWSHTGRPFELLPPQKVWKT